MPRQFFDSTSPETTYTLHVFCDASKSAYAAAAYLRKEDSESVQVKLIFAKSRLSPIKNATTIPRLELSSITIASSIAKYLHREMELPLAATYIWSDSKVALQWVKSGKHLPVFIQNRISAITKNSPSALLRHVPSEYNCADIASRGCSLMDLILDEQRWNGPAFLRQDMENWPEDISEIVATEEPETPIDHATFAAPVLDDIPMRSFTSLLPIDRYSRWDSLLTVTAMIIFFLVKKFKLCHLLKIIPWISDNHRSDAMLLLFRHAQRSYPPTEKLRLQLQLYAAPDGLLRCRGRLDSPLLSKDFRHPIYLPRESRITQLYIMSIHRQHHRPGTSLTLMFLRQLVWIPKGRFTVKKVLHQDCFKCRRYNPRPFQLPLFPDFPSQRLVRPPYPFWNTAVDYCGPFYCKDSINEKVYVCLFTCLNIRAIYVDLAVDMSAKTYCNILRRFIATNGSPNWLLSDNAPQFKCVADAQTRMDLRTSETDNEVVDYLKKTSIIFKFIPAFSPRSGGIYERMIALFKNSFKFAVGRRKLNSDDLRTITKEVEAIVNCRPLTYVPSNDSDIFVQPLRPIDFLRPDALLGTPRFDRDHMDEWKPHYTTGDELIRDWLNFSSTLDKFWTRWSTEYLSTLREQFTFSHGQGRLLTRRSPIIGEVVFIHNEYSDRGQWSLARIVKFNDPEPRSVQLLQPNHNTITRPINLIYPLEAAPSPESIPAIKTSTPPRHAHPMKTRSSTKMALLAITIFFGLFLPSSALPAIHTVPNTRCPEDPTLLKTIIYGDRCVKEGVAIASYLTSTNQPRVCWFPVSCPIGQLRIEFPLQLNTAFCGEDCPCPKWSDRCSHYNGSRKWISTINSVPHQLLYYVPKHVCSFNKSSLCSSQKRLGVFSQVELFDGTKFIVPDLHLDIPDLVNHTEFKCFTMTGNATSSPGTSATGTSAYCSQYACTTTNPKTFCTFPTAPTFYDSDILHMPVHAWGHTTREYYPPKLEPDLQEQHYVRCSKGGAQIYNGNLQFIEACIGGTCIYISNYTDMSFILFPTSLVIYKYNLSVSAWKDGNKILQEQLQCEGQPICEVITCSICKEHLYNVQCWTWSEVFVAFVTWIVLTILFYILRPTFTMMELLARMLLCPIKRSICILCSFLRFCKRRPAPSTSTPDNNTSRFRSRYQRRRPNIPAIALCMMIMPAATLACSDITSFTAGTRACTTEEPTESCSYDETTIITLQPIGQESSLVLRNQEGQPMGVLSIRLNGVTNLCNKKESFYTRDHVFRSESSHRCYKAGSCQSERCSGTTTRDRLEEFSTIANDSPGYTFCVGSCQCITCNKCFLCEPSCLFYRYFVAPEGSTVYTVFRCPTWSMQVTGSATLRTGNATRSTSFTLSPARKFTWNDISLTLTGVTSPHIPLLGNTFFTDGSRTAMIEDVEPGHFTLNSPRQLQCQSHDDAKHFKCTFPIGACTCSPSSYSVKCTCPTGLLQPYLNKNTLPLSLQGVILKNEKGVVTATSQQGSAIQVQATISGMQLSARRELNVCSVSDVHFYGCYSCTTGANFDFICRSSIGEETADIKCNNQSVLAVCNPSGRNNTLRLYYEIASVAVNCSLSCPGGSSVFEIEGQLHYVNEGVYLDPKQAEAEDRTPTDTDLSFAESIFKNLFDHWKFILIIIIVSVVAIFLLYLYLYVSRINSIRKLI